jgi:predicted enzyme related to lactoylglutathione lyase
MSLPAVAIFPGWPARNLIYAATAVGPNRFGRYELLTTDIPAARAFYAEIFGADFWGTDFTIATLPEQARARGAKPHFRGQLSVTDVGGPLQRVLSGGGMQLGPLLTGPHGARVGLRDQFGAMFTLTAEVLSPPRPLVAWHLMAAQDHQPAFALYSELFGWTPTGTVDLGPQRGQHQLFSWDDCGVTIGSISNLARLPHIHTQWLFYFRVDDVERSAARVTELGGLALPSVRGADGAAMAACDDGQGGAFGLYQG